MSRSKIITGLAALFLAGGVMQAQQIYDRAEDVKPLLPGMKIPEVTFETLDGGTFDLNKAVAEKPALVLFYRGGW